MSLASYRKSGQEVRTPLWFAEQSGVLYLTTRDDSWKYKRMRNNPRVRIAPCTFRGHITGEWSDAVARALPRDQEATAREALRKKYWLLRVPWPRSSHNVYVALEQS